MIKYTDLPDEVKLAEDEDDKKKGRRIETDEELAQAKPGFAVGSRHAYYMASVAGVVS